MGMTAHGCHLHADLKSPEGLQQLAAQRVRLRHALGVYLSDAACVEGTPADLDMAMPEAALLSRAYVNLVHSELAQHDGDAVASTQSLVLLGQLFACLWLVPSQLQVSSIRVEQGPLIGENLKSALRVLPEFLQSESEKLRRPPLKELVSEEIVNTAKLLGQAYVKGCVELSVAVAGQQKAVIRHHAALVGDVAQQMIELVNWLNAGEDTEDSLPADHPHRKSRKLLQAEP